MKEENMYTAEAGNILNTEYDNLVRAGLHCAPIAHKTLRSFPEGTIRISMGYFNTLEEMEITANAIRKIAERAHS